MCAFLLWFAFSWGAGCALAAEAADDVRFPPPALVLDTPGSLPLDGRSLYWIDDGRGLSAAEVDAHVEELPWRVRRRDTHGAVQSGVAWVLFEAATPGAERWYLEVAASANDRIELFYRDASGAWVRQQAGTDFPVSLWAVPGRVPTFSLARAAARPVRYLLRLEDERVDLVAPLVLLREDVLQQHREREQFVFGGYFGLLALVALAALASGLAFRDRAFLVFGLYSVLLALGQLGRVGVGSQHLWRDYPVWNERMLALWPGAAAAAALWLIKILTNPARLSRFLDLGVWTLIAGLLAATALHMTVNTHTSVTLVLALTGLSLVAIFSMVLWGWLDGHERHLALVACAMLPVLVLATFPLARALGLASTNLLTRFGLFFGTVLEMPLLYYALTVRLMQRREAQLRAAALSRTDPLTGLPHRRALIERLDGSLNHARAQKQNCALLGVRIANLDAIGEELGREAMEKALVVAASHLRRAAVGYDMAARVAEREFALLVEAPLTREAATARAQQVVASGLQPVDALPGVTLKFHVTLAMLPRPQLDGAGTLHWVLEALDQITPDARKLIRFLD